MPHLNFEFFATQYCWLIITLGVWYYLVANNQGLAEILKLRRKAGSGR